jgi:hypothetical protein
MKKKKNVIILTSGLSGSSVLTGLIAGGGYWTGDSTFKKPDYETFENQELIDLNKKLFKEAGYKGNYAFEFSAEAMNRIAGLYGKIDPTPYQEFIKRCSDHEPWIWKDPRLWLTIRFWKNIVNLDNCAFVLLSRDVRQAWISSLLRRQITTFRYARNYETSIHGSLVSFLQENNRTCVEVKYEELIQNPAVPIQRLNAHLDAGLTVDHLKAIYHKPLYKSPNYSTLKHMKAMLIYLKNYSERLDLAG